MQILFMTLSMMTAIFLILLVLVQRGRGGGLTGALGGMGGQSAFGSKAGDLFTRVTIGVAAFWIVLSVTAIKVLNTPDTVFGDTDKTTFEDKKVPSLTTDPLDDLPSDRTGTLTTEDPLTTPDEPAETSSEPAPSATDSETSSEPAAPATEDASAAPAEAPATAEPAASSSAEPAATEPSEATPEKAATPEASE